jgi:hypothetical protein
MVNSIVSKLVLQQMKTTESTISKKLLKVKAVGSDLCKISKIGKTSCVELDLSKLPKNADIIELRVLVDFPSIVFKVI